MEKQRGAVQRSKVRRLATVLAVATSLGLFTRSLPAQNGIGPAAPPVKERFLVDRFPDKPSLPPSFSIPVAPLGFTAPSSNYLGARNSFVSLDFIGEDRLLFTFRVPGLIHRDTKSGEESEERQIRALLLKLPEGTVEAEALWTVHDRVRYLWPLANGHFLVRDRNTLFEGDATLRLKPFLDFPGNLLWIELDPAQQFMVTNSREPAAEQGHVASPSTASAPVTTDQDSAAAQEDKPELVVRILRRETGQVMLVSRVRMTVHLPINSEGYLEMLRGSGQTWVLNLAYFAGGNRILGKVESACSPPAEFLTKTLALVNVCDPEGGRDLVAMTTDGRRLWDAHQAPTQVWPLLIHAPDGSRVARETIMLDHAVDGFANMIDSGSMKAQLVEVFDSGTGKRLLKAPASPLLDGGGNVAISPSGNRVAILSDGAIQVYQIGAVPAAVQAKP